MRRAFALLFASACGSPDVPACPTGPGVLVVATDETSSSQTGFLPLDGTPAAMLSATKLGSDPALATSAGRHFFVARAPLDTILELDGCGRSTNQFSARAVGETGPVNPQDVAVDSTGAIWIARLPLPPVTAASVLVLAQSAVTAIDLSSFDSDGYPDASSIRIVDGRAFVALERLNPYPTSTQPSEIAVLDTATKTGVATIQLAGRNPFGVMVESPGKLWLAEPGNFADAAEPDAGIEVVDTTTLKSSLLISETTLGASVAQVAIGALCGAAIVADSTSDNPTSLVSFTLDGKTIATALGPTTGFDLRGLLWTANDRLLVGDERSSASGFPVHVFSADGACALTPGADLSLPNLPAFAFATP